MAKQKKEAIPVTIRMKKEIFDQLVSFCDDSGQSKTTAIERALAMYIKDYNDKQSQINKQ